MFSRRKVVGVSLTPLDMCTFFEGEAVPTPTRLLVESTFRLLVSTVTSPETVKLPKVPTLVMLVCAAVSTEPVKSPVTLPVIGAVTPANVGLSVVATPWFNALTDASLVSSESIKAPAAVTLAVSVTSALASIPSSLVPSVATSRPSIRPSVVKLPDTAGVDKVLLERVCVPVSVATVLSIAKVTALSAPLVSIPVPPVNVIVSESRSILRAPPVSAWKSKSCAVTCESTYALTDC